MKNFHTVIVGGGPGGLACATHLARQGKEVLVLERNSTIGPKVCAGGIPSAAQGLGFPETLWERSFVQQHIRSNWQHAMVQDDTPIIRTVDRGRLGRWMADRAVAAGVTIATNTLVLKISDDRVHTRGGEEFGFSFLVGADGSSSVVRRQLGIPTENIGVGINYQVPGNFPEMQWHLNTDLFGNGYAWIFPHQDSASIGVYARRSTSKPGDLLNSLHHWGARHNLELKSRQPQAALINFDFRGYRFNNRFLVGDAAGLASGLTGEGIYSAIISGEEVARTILHPGYESKKMTQLIKKHQQHARILELASGHPLTGKLILEGLVFCLRTGLLPFSSLEMGIDQPSRRIFL
ncbi:NAD(P)/FAD-dependent oxidoreductase [Thiovibrio frasassiensis]|jgi:geranylgeranyl reductase|uniref:NAD(P)/FAD-dependent oxidoreductase n=1 Tax=Thiovibrio frasassiensis TaxID=2984131 RepID=A0A9X4MH45_9BACT|nr:NAD(P)/FAD-dependent oxidoreductase [Thiovibrio frasassiensis]MDG4476130.1 NAD(P)/FAD-dependent oxidoreductase [Thiovibrio frasassiensis]